MRFIKNNLIEIITIILLLTWFNVGSQVTIDRGLALQLDYMAHKARQLDSFSIELLDANKGLKQYSLALDSLNQMQKSEMSKQLDKIANLELKNTSLTSRLNRVNKALQDCSKDIQKLKGTIEDKDDKIRKLTTARNNHRYVNIGFGAIIIASIVAIVSDSN